MFSGGAVDIDRSSLDFTMLPCGGTSSITITLHNGGDREIAFTISSDISDVTMTPTSGTIPAGGRFEISVVATADAIGTPGVPIVGELLVQTDNPALDPITLPMMLSTSGGVVMVDQTTVDFGQVSTATAHTQNVMLENTGNTKVTVTAGPFTDAAFTVTSPATFDLPAGGSQQVSIQFNPPMSQSYSYQLPLQVSGAMCQALPRVDVTGSGSLNAILIDHTAIDFGAVGCPSPTAMTPVMVTNTNSASYPYTASITAGAASFGVMPASGMVPANNSMSIDVARAAIVVPAMTGPVAGTLHLAITGAPGTTDLPLQYDVSGASLTASSTLIDFGSGVLGGSKTVTITNSGNQIASVTVTRAGSTDFSGPSAFQVSPGMMKAISFTYLPHNFMASTADFALDANNLCSTPLSIHAVAAGFGN